MINVLMSSYKKAKCETFIVNNLIVQVKFQNFKFGQSEIHLVSHVPPVVCYFVVK